MNKGPDFSALQSATDQQLEEFGAAAAKSDVRVRSTAVSAFEAEKKRRAEARQKAKLEGLEKQREETVRLLQERPGRRATLMGGGGNNPFSLT